MPDERMRTVAREQFGQAEQVWTEEASQKNVMTLQTKQELKRMPKETSEVEDEKTRKEIQGKTV